MKFSFALALFAIKWAAVDAIDESARIGWAIPHAGASNSVNLNSLCKTRSLTAYLMSPSRRPYCCTRQSLSTKMSNDQGGNDSLSTQSSIVDKVASKGGHYINDDRSVISFAFEYGDWLGYIRKNLAFMKPSMIQEYGNLGVYRKMLRMHWPRLAGSMKRRKTPHPPQLNFRT